MPYIGGTLYNLSSKEPTVVDTELKGGFQVVANQTERLAIEYNKRKIGMRVAQADTQKVYRLTSLGTGANDSFGNPTLTLNDFTEDTASTSVVQSTVNQVGFFNTATTVSGAQNFVYSGGSVGIGTAIPREKLHILGNSIIGADFDAVNGYPSSDLIIHAGDASIALGQENAISIFRQQTGASWSQIATLSLGRYEVAGSSPRTRLDFNLKHNADATDTAEVTVMTLNSNRNVGINTTSPNNRLDVRSTTTPATQTTYGVGIGTTSTTDVTIGADASYGYIQTWNSKPLYINSQGNNVLLGSGNVGIGTVTANSKLHIAGNYPTIKLQETSAIAGGTSLEFLNSSGVLKGNIYYDVISNYLSVATNGSSKFFINGSGNVGIGTINPTAGLTIYGTAASPSASMAIISSGYSGINYPATSIYLYNGSNTVGVNHPRLQFISSRGTEAAPAAITSGDQLGSISWWAADSLANLYEFAKIDVWATGTIGNTSVPTYMRFFTSAAERMRIAQDGNIGIGTTNPLIDLHVYANTGEIARFENNGTNDGFIRVRESSTEDVVLGSNNGIGFVGSSTNNNFAIRTNNTNRVTIDTNGNVGIGITNPSNKLQVSGDIYATNGVRVGNTQISTDTIEVSAYGTGNRNAFIDLRGDDVFTDYGLRLLRAPATNPVSGLIDPWYAESYINHRGYSPLYFNSLDGGAIFLRISNSSRYQFYLSDAYFYSALEISTGASANANDTPLRIYGYGQRTSSFRYYAYGGYGSLVSNQSINVGAYVEYRVLADEFDAFSDSRSKELLVSPPVEEIKQKYKQINIVDFKMKDGIYERPRIGILAQEMENIFPDAVSMTKNYIPSLYIESETLIKDNNKHTISISKSHDLKIDDNVSIFYISDNKELEEIVKVIEIIDDKTFTFNTDKTLGDKVFLWGKEVDDFRTMNYQYLNGLTAKMTQYLLEENEQLKSKLEEKDAQIANILERLAALENR
jgi:hypothetical protein